MMSLSIKKKNSIYQVITNFISAFLLFSIPSLALAIPVAFDVTSVTAFDSNNQTAVGTSNGVGWSLGSTHFSSCCGTSITGGYTGFNSSNFITPIVSGDSLHITQSNFTITFDQTIDDIVFYVRENGGSANFDFGLTPTFLSGVSNFTQIGGVGSTRYGVNTSGGAFQLSGLNTNTLTHSASVFDGMEMAFFVQQVPEPSIIALFGIGLIGFSFARRHRQA